MAVNGQGRRPKRFVRGATIVAGALMLGAVFSSAGAEVQQAQNLLPPQLVTVSPRTLAAQRILAARIDGLGRGFDGDVGIAIKDVQSGWTTDFDGSTWFPQQSVSKFWVSLAAMDKVDSGALDLNRTVTLGRDDLTLFNQPIAQLVRRGGYTTTLADLMNRALQQSDNTANDVLLRQAGGPEAVRTFLRGKGIEGVRFGPGERLMQSEIAGMSWSPSYSAGNAFQAARNLVPLGVRRVAFDRYIANPVDGATPLGTVEALSRLKAGELLSPASTQRIITIMSNTRTGPRRLKGGLAPGWRLAHKTGTGQVLGGVQAGYNDIGILTAPDGRSFAVAVLIRRTSTPLGERMQLMQNVTRSVIDYVEHQRDGDMAIAASSMPGNGSD